MSSLGELFKQIRISKKWSIRQAAKNMGLSYSYLSILEKGIDPRTGKDSNPKPETLRIISQAYDYPYEELMKAAGYLNDETSTNQFDLEIFVRNIYLIMGKMTVEDFSNDIYEKTGYHIKPSQIKGYLDGDIQPFPGTLNILSKYACVTKEFWYCINNHETLEIEKRKYMENLLKTSTEPFSKDYIFFSNLRDDIKEFVLNEDSLPYIKAAMEAQQKNINPNTLKLLVDTIASEMGTK